MPGITPRSDGRPFVVVHGGAESRRYRNVLDALETALALEADYFEFDVRRTADGVLVVHHDDVIADTPLRELTFDSACRAADGQQYRVPRVEDVLSRARGRLRLDVELKETGHEAAVLQLLRSHGFAHDQFVVTSFEQPALDAVHATDPAVVTGLLTWDVTGLQALELFQQSAATFLGPDHTVLDDETLRAAVAQGIPLTPWTVNDPPAIRRLMEAQAVIGLITDDPMTALSLR
jgi:glycerophosphoryl diester phosphodiesterase